MKPVVKAETTELRMPARRRPKRSGVLITGGAGFIGTNLAKRLAEAGETVIVYDNLARPGVERNLQWLSNRYPREVEVEVADVRDARTLTGAVARADAVYHFAAQVAVTSSLDDPLYDFEVNACSTLNLLEALRAQRENVPLIFTSTNKVYGSLSDLPLIRGAVRYEPATEIWRCGIGEDRRLDFHSPYGCSKGTADQYVLDYARTRGLRAVVFRMSCIYGPHQWGTEDQGWVAHFLIRALEDEPIVLYGDGRQVRDLLFVDDLVDALVVARDRIGELGGQAFNIGGGPGNATSLLELVELVGRLRGVEPEVRFADWRPGDQRYYVSDTRRFQESAGWRPRVPVEDGVARLHEWLRGARARVTVPPAAGATP